MVWNFKFLHFLAKDPDRTFIMSSLLAYLFVNNHWRQIVYKAYYLESFLSGEDFPVQKAKLMGVIVPAIVAGAWGMGITFSSYILDSFLYKDELTGYQKGDSKKKRVVAKRIDRKTLKESLKEVVYSSVQKSPSSLTDLFHTYSETLFPFLKRIYKRVKVKPDREFIHFINEASFKMISGKVDESFLMLKKAFLASRNSKIKLSALYWLVFPLYYGLNKARSIRNSRSFNTYFILATANLILNKRDKALWYSTFASEFAKEIDSPSKLEVSVLDAFFTEALGSSLSEEKWKDVLDLSKEIPYWERVGETKGLVKVINKSEFLKNSLVFKLSDSLDDLVSEAEAASFFNEHEIPTSQPLYISQEPDEEGFYSYVQAFVSGMTLLDYLKKENQKQRGSLKEFFKHFCSKQKAERDVLNKVVRTLFRIHDVFPVENVRYGKLDLAQALEKRVNNPYLGISHDAAKNFKEGYGLLVDLFSKFKSLWRYNKDAHPENWLITDNNDVVVIDTENTYLSPVVFDLANLLGYGSSFSVSEVEGYNKIYHDLMKQADWGKLVDLSNFNLLFWNAVLHRSFFLCSAWSSPERSSLHSERLHLVENALSSFDVIRDEFRNFYSFNKSSYSALEDAFKYLQDYLNLD